MRDELSCWRFRVEAVDVLMWRGTVAVDVAETIEFIDLIRCVEFTASIIADRWY